MHEYGSHAELWRCRYHSSTEHDSTFSIEIHLDEKFGIISPLGPEIIAEIENCADGGRLEDITRACQGVAQSSYFLY